MSSIRKRGRNHYYTFTDENGKRTERKGCASLTATKEIAAAEETRVARIRAGLETRACDLTIEQELEDWERWMKSRGCTDKHIERQLREVRRIAFATKTKSADALTAAKIQAALAASGLSAQSQNHCRASLRAFFRWLRDEGRHAGPIPTARVAVRNVETDRRRARRSLSVEEFVALLDATEASAATYRGFDPQARSLLYRLAAGTGLRANELRRLEVRSFRLDDEPPVVVVEARDAKNRKPAAIPLYADLAARVAAWIRERELSPGSSFWPAEVPKETARDLLLRDLERAGIPYVTEEGAADFHSLRVYCGTQLVRAGVSIAAAQKFLRHSTPVLTLRTYAKLASADLADAASRLAVPGPSSPAPPCAAGPRS